MKIIAVLVLSAVVVDISESCNFTINGHKYSKTIILEIGGLPTNLAFNNFTGDLFFTLIDIESLLNDEVETKMDEYVLNSNGTTKISNFNGQTAAVDTTKGIVFLGSDSGLHVFNDITKLAVSVGLREDDIVQLYLSPNSDHLYAVLYPSSAVYVISDGGRVKRHIEEIESASIVAVDKKDNIYFQRDSKCLSVLLKGFKEPISYVGLKPDAGRVLVANGDKIVAATFDGLYELSPDNVIPNKIADLDYVPSGLVFHEDDIYIATSGKIFKYSKRAC